MTVEDGGAPQGSANPITDRPSAAGSRAADQHIDLRDLATLLAPKDTKSACVIKGIVTAIDLNGDPPTIAVQVSGDSSVDIPGVRFIDSYSPVVGDTVLMVKQRSEFFALGQMARAASSPADNGWVTPSLASNVSAHAFDPVRYRVVMRDGERVVKLRGGVNLSGTPTALWTMPSGVRPVVNLTPLLIARNPDGGSNVAQLQVNANGTMVLAGATTGGGTSGSGGGGSTGSSSPGTNVNGEHRHWVFADGEFTDWNGPHSHTVNSHSHSMSSHTHSIPAPSHPTWLSFNGVEYVL